MAAVRESAKLQDISAFIKSSTNENYWIASSGKELEIILEKLPLQLAKNGTYLFNKKNSSLEISEESRGISIYRITDADKVDGIELRPKGIYLSIRGISGLSKIILVKEPVAIPAKANSLASFAAPIDLLDEYADLRLKSRTQALNSIDRLKQAELVKAIGKEFVSRAKSKAIPSYRSTPVSDGESRGYSSQNRDTFGPG